MEDTQDILGYDYYKLNNEYCETIVNLKDRNKNILIVGYYDHNNLGDEQYKITFNLLLSFKYNIRYLDCDKLSKKDIDQDTIIILGGGDVLNEYFLDKLNNILDKNHKNKVLAVSVGLPYNNILTNTNKLSILDYIFIRTEQDLGLFKKYFDSNRIIYLPDISLLLKIEVNITQELLLRELNPKRQQEVLKKQATTFFWRSNDSPAGIQPDRKNIVISLSRHFYNIKCKNDYLKIVNKFSNFIIKLLSFNKYSITFIPFNTSNRIKDDDKNQENDILFQRDIINVLKQNDVDISHIILIDKTLTSYEALMYYKKAYISIPMRFHGTLFSIYENCPILPIYTTKKIKNFLLDIEWPDDLQYDLPKNNKDIPIDLDYNLLLNKFNDIVIKYDDLKNHLILKNKNFIDKFKLAKQKLFNTIDNPYEKKNNLILNNEIIINNLYNQLQNIAKNKCNIDDFRYVKDIQVQQLLINIVNYYLVNKQFNSIYTYGLQQKMFTENSFNYKDEFKWILNNVKPLNSILNNNKISINLSYINQSDISEAHRSGWQYVYENIKYLDNDNSDLIMDLYLDRTFHWQKDVMKYLNIIPYKKPWLGFIHHTFDTTFSEYNCDVMFKDIDFLESLKNCKGIIVLSEYLKKQIINQLNKIGYNIDVYVLIHPTLLNVPKFTLENFMMNNEKKIVHIGGWLRNIYSFYYLNISGIIKNEEKIKKDCFPFLCCNSIPLNDNLLIKKYALKGKNMNNYYYSDNFSVNSNINSNINIDINHDANLISRNINENINNWHKHFQENYLKLINSVEIIDKLENIDYDTLLTGNIVFINLVDASAVNTVIECIVRNTPLIVNKHPAVVELLGEEYPMYYINNHDYFKMSYEIEQLLSVNKIKETTNYLRILDKTNLDINKFVKNLEDIIANL